MARRVVEVHWCEDDTWRGYVTAAPASELLRQHVWATYVAGVSHYPSADTGCELGSPLELVPEPDNSHDANAVAIWTKDGCKIGYISRRIAADMDRSVNHRAVFLAETRIDGHRAGLWVLVSRDPVTFKVTPVPDCARSHLHHRIEHLKELTLSSLEPPSTPTDPIEAMWAMAKALNDEGPNMSVGVGKGGR